MPMPPPPDRLTARKSPKQGRSARTVEAILESAAHILETGGFDGYNTNAIAARAGASIGSVYQYFGSKDAITMALISAENEGLASALDSAAALTDPRAALDAMIAAAANHQLRRPRLARLLDLEERRLTPMALRNDAKSELLHRQVVEVVERIFGPHEEMSRVCTDLIVITRALCDAAGERDENSLDALQERIRKAVRGYLQEQFPPAGKALASDSSGMVRQAARRSI